MGDHVHQKVFLFSPEEIFEFSHYSVFHDAAIFILFVEGVKSFQKFFEKSGAGT